MLWQPMFAVNEAVLIAPTADHNKVSDMFDMNYENCCSNYKLDGRVI